MGSRGSVATGVAFFLVLVLALGAWLIWPRVAARLAGGDPTPSVASADLAESALDRFERFRSGQAGDRLALSGAEVSSVVRYAMPGLLPAGVANAEIALSGGRLALSARVATDAFPDLPKLDAVIGMLPDTVPVRVDGEITSYGKESLAFRVDHVEAATIPLPDRLIPNVLDALGRKERDGLPANAMQLPLPGGVASVSVERDSLVLAAGR